MRVGAHGQPESLGDEARRAAVAARDGSAAGTSPVPQSVSGSRLMARPRRRGALGWWVTFLALAVTAILAVSHYAGVDALAASGRFLWNAMAAVANSALRTAGGLLALLARGIGWRRLARVSHVIMGIGLSYAGGVILTDRAVRRAQGWRGKGRLLLARLRKTWVELPLAAKLLIVALLITSQVYLHVVLIVFPVAFLVPVVRRVWVQAADIVLGSWYWRKFGALHRSILARLRNMAGVHLIIGAARLTRIRYLTAWRLWRYHPRYQSLRPGRRAVDLVEPLRLWRRGELDIYVGRPLLRGRAQTPVPAAAPPRAP